ncbi:hypothetical protein BKA62DRAFT_829544 [Auriculariales sp. MPI-PUGE-AT-0066]|nr:hypothetical protein BKA62DRAFT_829544 [Auriculariales sp. MPI-PUGE-AT-0066]
MMTATIQPTLPPFGMGLGLSLDSSSSNNQNGLPSLPPVSALMNFHLQTPLSRARSADDVTAGRPKKASAALAQFAADWGRLPRSHPRFADGAAILQKINPRTVDNRTIEVLAQMPRDSSVNNNMGALLRSSELDLVRTELRQLHPDRCVGAADLDAVPAALDSGEPLVMGIHAPRDDGLGAITSPIRLPQKHGAAPSSAVILGPGAIARTTTPLHTPVLTRQVVGRALIVYWVPVTTHRAPAGASFLSTMNRMMSGATLRSVVLATGQWCILPKNSVYVTLSLGDKQEPSVNYAVQVKFSVHLPPASNVQVGGKRKADDRWKDEHEHHSQSSSSYAGSVCSDGEPEHDGCSDDDCDECRAERRFKRARTVDDDRDDVYITNHPNAADLMVTRARDSSAFTLSRFHSHDNHLHRNNVYL